MKTNIKTFLVLVAATGLAMIAPAFAGSNVKIIANPSVKADSISAEELKSVFLEEKLSLSDGSRVEPVVSRGGRAHEAFLREYLGKSDSDLQNYYRSLVFTGKGAMPKAIVSDSELAAYVAKTRGAIGYVSSETSTEGVKTLAVLGVENDGTRRLITRVEPIYPAALRDNHIGGTVRLKVMITQNGSVEAAELIGGNPVLGEAAQAAVKKWVYAPSASKTKTEVTIPFDPGH